MHTQRLKVFISSAMSQELTALSMMFLGKSNFVDRSASDQVIIIQLG